MPTSYTKSVILDSTGEQIVDSLLRVKNALVKKESIPIIYGFHINSNESDPSAAVTYLEDAAGMTPAKMDYMADRFDYGSWENAFFMPRPCMVRYNGSVDYYLDPNDYNKKEDGTASDLDTMEHAVKYPGNAMMEWGKNNQQIWMKVVPDTNSDDASSGSVYISNKQVDSSYTAYPFINNQGSLVDHFYTAIYDGSITAFKDSSNNTRFRLRSIPYRPIINSNISGSGYNEYGIPLESDPTTIITNIKIDGTVGAFAITDAINDVSLAYNNNLGLTPNQGNLSFNESGNTTRRPYVLWNTEVLCDIQLINNLLILIGKSLDTQTVFGMGDTNSLNNGGFLYTGSIKYKNEESTYEPVYGMNQKGLFWGSNNDYSCVKVFGMENWWGNQYRRYNGLVNSNNYYNIKMTYGLEDGSSVIGYILQNSTSYYDDKYINTNIAIPITDGFIKKHVFSVNNTVLPYAVDGTGTTYYCDYHFFSGAPSSSVAQASHGGYCNSANKLNCGAFFLRINTAYTSTSYSIGSALSFKPIA